MALLSYFLSLVLKSNLITYDLWLVGRVGRSEGSGGRCGAHLQCLSGGGKRGNSVCHTSVSVVVVEMKVRRADSEFYLEMIQISLFRPRSCLSVDKV